MPSVGYAVLQIIPSVRGIGDELRRQLVAPAGDAGGDAGEAAGGGLKDKLKLGAAAAGVAAGALLVAGLSEAMEQADLTRTLQASSARRARTRPCTGGSPGSSTRRASLRTSRRAPR